MRSYHYFSAALLAVSWISAHAQKTIDVKVVVLKNERVAIGEQPISDIGGFIIRQQSTAYEKAKCPNASNAKGELVCQIECLRKEGTLRLYLSPPNQVAAPRIRGLFVPSEVGFDVANCVPTVAQPIRLIYKSQEVMISEFQASQPVLFNAIIDNAPAWDGKTLPKLKPFNQVSTVLAQQAVVDKTAIVKFAEFSAAFEQEAKESKNTDAASKWGEYVVGSQSITLRMAAMEALGEGGGQAVRISSKKADLLQSASTLEKAIGRKPALGPRDLSALQEVNSVRQSRFMIAQ